MSKTCPYCHRNQETSFFGHHWNCPEYNGNWQAWFDGYCESADIKDIYTSMDTTFGLGYQVRWAEANRLLREHRKLGFNFVVPDLYDYPLPDEDFHTFMERVFLRRCFRKDQLSQGWGQSIIYRGMTFLLQMNALRDFHEKFRGDLLP